MTLLRMPSLFFGLVGWGLMILSGCQQGRETKPLLKIEGNANQVRTVLVLSDTVATQSIVAQAHQLGVLISGKEVIQLTGPIGSLNQLSIESGELVSALVDEPLRIEKVDQSDPLPPDETIHYLAKRDFGLLEFWKAHPLADGRGVRVAVIDDGVSPLNGGLAKTSEGKRKLLARKWRSTLLNRNLTKISNPEQYSEFVKSLSQERTAVWQGELDENLLRDLSTNELLDLNQDKTFGKISLAVLERAEGALICVDSNGNQRGESNECFHSFISTGEFGFWTTNQRITLEAEFDGTSGLLQLSQGERSGDSHGEGTASVIAGYRLGGKFDGVAPGAQLLDYDLGDASGSVAETSYTIGTFLESLEWLGEQQTEVINISYSLFFGSVKSQEFMRQALDRLVSKYGFVIGFSAGNNGPGLGSLNRREIYPENSLVAGAFVSHDLDEYVHGVTGLPPEGRVVSYSSRGPGPDSGRGPLLISPLASLTHADVEGGFQAFSGTSSASPALAGLAAVLISAVKQQGLKVDPGAVVHSLRLSAQPLPGVPFIDQGFGMPNAERALALYPKLINGETFTRIDSNLGNNGRDGNTQRGLLLFDSQLRESTRDVPIFLTGVVAATVAADVAGNLLIPLDLSYSASWISGPAHLWASIGESTLVVAIDIEKLRQERTGRGGEAHAEIRLRDSVTGLLLQVVPVTVIDDRPLENKTVQNIRLEAEQGIRSHWSIRSGQKGAWIHNEAPLTLLRFVGFILYNPAGVIVDRYRGKDLVDIFVDFSSQSGWFQTAFSRSLGTPHPYQIQSTVTPINLEFRSQGIPQATGTVELFNLHESIDGWLEAIESPQRISSGFALAKDGEFSIEMASQKSGIYELNVELAHTPEISYSRLNCFSAFEGGEASVALRESFSVKVTTEVPGKLKFICRPFDFTSDMKDSPVLYRWVVDRKASEKDVILGEVLGRFPPGHSSVKLKWVKPPEIGSTVTLRLRPPIGVGNIKLGSLEVY